MPSRDGTGPAPRSTPVPIDGDGEELIGMLVDGRYRLDSTLGRGGMGLVYRAHHIGLRRQVAVKILHPALAASPEVRNRFEREALAVGKIDHPNCVSVYDSGRLPDGSLYLAMELLDGKSLADVMEAEGQLAPGRALHILSHILRGLSHIHQAGLIHRDIKPENIFLIRQGEDLDFAKILDFGIAKGMTSADLDDGVKLTQAGMAFGTPIYMAPEQALGNPMDGRADLYAAAVMGYEMLAGQPPFYSEDKLEVMSMHTARPVPPMRSRLIKNGRTVPSSLERLIAKGLTKKPSDRYANADIFLAEVEAALHTPDGGVTDVQFERPSSSTTGSQPLVSQDGQVRITGASDFVDEQASENILSAIDEELSSPKMKRVATPAKGAGLPPGLAQATRGSHGKIPQGGVGLGLPYTGPSGEPIFGLTPEQRLAHATSTPAFVGKESGVANALEPDASRTIRRVKSAASRKKLVIYGAIVAAAAVAGVLIAVLTSRPTEDTGEPGLDPNTIAGQANVALEKGDPNKAIAILDAQKDQIAKDPMAQLVLGHAYSSRHDSGRALLAYATALKYDPRLEVNQTLRASLRAMGADSDLGVVGSAFELWAGHTTDPEAKPLLLKAAISQDLARRHAVLPIIEKLKLESEVELWIAYSFDLEQEASCELRREAVSKLRALEDRRAVEPLERAVIRKTKNRKPYNPCLIDDAKAAIGFLKGLEKKGS